MKASNALVNAKMSSAGASSTTLPDAAKDLVVSMSSDNKQGLGAQTHSLAEIAQAIKPILDSFDDVLVCVSNSA